MTYSVRALLRLCVLDIEELILLQRNPKFLKNMTKILVVRHIPTI